MNQQYENQQTQIYHIGNNNYQVTRIFSKNKDIRSLISEKITIKNNKAQN